MVDPVIDAEGNSYERDAIDRWLQTNSTSPVTRNPLRRQDLRENLGIRETIRQITAARQQSSQQPKASQPSQQPKASQPSQQPKASQPSQQPKASSGHPPMLFFPAITLILDFVSLLETQISNILKFVTA